MGAFNPIIGWLAPIVSTLIICAGQLEINRRFKVSEEKRDKEREETEAKRKAEAEWRERVERYMSEQDKKLDALTDGVQTTMRTDLIHLYEKFTTRGWITPEERAAWHDMHTKYSALNANGLIDSYSAKLDELPDREI